MKVLGLTGGIGSGKSFVAAEFAGRGYPVIDADKVCRGIYVPGGACLAEVTAAFGERILFPDGSLNRKALGQIVFADREALDRLNVIAHKYIAERIEEQIAHFTKVGKKGIILDAPQLFEAGIHRRCDAVIAVVAPMVERIARVIARDGLTEREVADRMAMQHDDDFFRAHADYLIENSDGADLISQINTIITEELTNGNES